MATPYLWSDAELTIFVNDSIRRVVRETRSSPESEVISMGVSAGRAVYTLRQDVVEVVRAGVSSSNLPLKKTTIVQLDGLSRLWQTEQGKSARGYVLDFNARTVRLYPIPNTDDTLTLSVITMPEAMVFEGAGRRAEIPLDYKYHHMLSDGVMGMCYLKDTPDTQSLQKSAFYEARFAKGIAQILTERRWENDTDMPVNIGSAYL